VFQPSEFAKLALAVWVAAYLSRRLPPRTLKQLARPVGLLAGLYALLLLAEPDLGTAIALILMLGAVLLVAGTPVRLLALAIMIAGAAGTLAIWIEPYRRARFFSFLHPWHDAQARASRSQAMIDGPRPFGVGLKRDRKLFYLPRRRPT
jgi:cell division protein FtsW